jgi:hypothetical protein
MFEENEGDDDDSYGTTSMDLGELEEMEDALEEEEELEEEKVIPLNIFRNKYKIYWGGVLTSKILTLTTAND